MSAATVKAGLVTVLTSALAADTNVQVSYGTPGPSSVPDVVAVLDVQSDEDGDEETYEFVLVVSCYVGGGDEAQATATLRAHTLFAAARAAIVAAPTLSGTCRVAALSTRERTAETVAYDDGGAPVGRLTEITATVTAWSGRPLVGSVASAHNVP
jgi:cyanophycinase-like exopeptidase